MKNIAILVPETAVIEAVADPRYLFSAVNEFLKSSGRQPLFNVQLVGLRKEIKVWMKFVRSLESEEEHSNEDLKKQPTILLSNMRRELKLKQQKSNWKQEEKLLVK